MTEARKAVVAFELVDHGIENSSYFQGCGLAFTEYEGIATGCGNDPAEAIDDALEQLACSGEWDVEGMEARILAEEFPGKRKLPTKPSVPADAEDCYYYVSIRVR